MKKLIRFFLSCILVLASSFLTAQTGIIDSLQNFLKTSKEDTTRVIALIKLSGQYTNTGNYEQAVQVATQAYNCAVKINYKKGTAGAYHSIGNTHYFQGNYQKALDDYFNSLKIREEIDDKKGIADSYNNIGAIYNILGNYENALNSHLKSLAIKKNIGNKNGTADSYLNIGNIYQNQGNYEKALDNFLKSLIIKEEVGDKYGIANCFNNIGNIYYYQENYAKALSNYFTYLALSEENENHKGMADAYDNIGIVYNIQGDYEKALENTLKSLTIKEKIGDKKGIAHSYNNIGNIYYCQFEKPGNAVNIADLTYNSFLAESLKNYLKGINIYKEIGDKQGAIILYSNIGRVYMKQGKLQDAYNYFNQVLINAEEIGYKEGIKDAYSLLSDLFDKKGDYKQAYNYHNRYSELKDTLLNEQSSKQIVEMNTKYDSEKKDKELILKDAEISKQHAETEKQNLQKNTFIIGFALVLVLAFFIFRSYRQKQNANKLLEEKNILIEHQKQLVEEKNGKITDSINYAKRIQDAILPSQQLMETYLPKSFVFFKPKAIVSGDFYWIHAIDDNQVLLAVADCTGHGVPGALMSMMGFNLLEQVVKEHHIYEPDRILNELSEMIIKSLGQSDDLNAVKDGMDIALCKINFQKFELEYAGAHNPLYLIRNGKLIETKADRRNIGISYEKSEPFSNHKIKLEKGDCFYIFSDGYADQKGGPDNKRFFYKSFRELLTENHLLDIREQGEKLEKVITEWKADKEQIDDILVIGVKI